MKSKARIPLVFFIGAVVLQNGCGALKLGVKKSDSSSAAGGTPAPEDIPRLALYSDCAEIQSDVRSLIEMRVNDENAQIKYQKRFANHFAGIKVSAMSSPDSSNEVGASASTKSSGAESVTNVQEKGVDESDFIKVGAKHIYVIRQGQIKVSERTTLRELGELSIADLQHVTLYAEDDRLTVVGFKGGSNDQAFAASGGGSTVVRLYKSAAEKVPTLAKEHQFSGDYLDTRLMDGQLVTVFRSNLPLTQHRQDEIPQAPVGLDAGSETLAGVRCSSIAKPIIRDQDFRMSRIAVVNTVMPDKTVQQIATIGGGDLIYMTTRNIYLAKQNRSWWPWVDPGRRDPFAIYWREQMESSRLYLTKVSITRDGQLITTAAGSVAGRVKDQWAFKELAEDNLLTVATTTGELFGRRKALNHLYVLEQSGSELKPAAPVQDFAPGEDIRSVRHVGNIAYVVTFKKTDPLFAFDLSEPRSPKILGELKIPGFSTYMHPVADGRLLGIGFDAIDQGNFAFFDGIQVSLFDTSNPRSLARLDNHVLGRRGSGSDVTGDHHAFYFDSNANLIGVPVVMVNGSSSSQFGGGLQGVEFSGAVLYRLEGDKLNEVTRISHKDLMPAACANTVGGIGWWQDRFVSQDINRMYTLDGRLISISRFGIKAHELSAPDKVTTAVAFKGAGGCGSDTVERLPRAFD
jgi:uncharacterized secreted protein with C-terminal beta-propeller domain